MQEAEATAAASNRTLSQLQTSLNIAKQSLQSKTGELTRELSSVLCVADAQVLKRASLTLSWKAASRPSRTPSRKRRRRSTSVKSESQVLIAPLTRSEIADTETSVKFYKKILDLGKTKKKCLGCDRAIHENEKPHFEAYVRSRGFTTADLRSPHALSVVRSVIWTRSKKSWSSGRLS